MKSKQLLIILLLMVVLLTACSGNDGVFTPPVLESQSTKMPEINSNSTDVVDGEELPVLPLDTSQPEETVTIPETTQTEEVIQSVSSFPDPANYQWMEIASGFNKPLGMASYFDDNLVIFVLEQDGVIRILENGIILERPFLDIKNKTLTRGSEQGLLGIALDPDFIDNGIFYINYTGSGGDTIIARYLASDDRKTSDPSSEQIILTYEQPYSNHNGGNLVFGPDGYLYIGLGDGGSGGDPELRAQNPTTLLGKMVRIAVRDQDVYAVPPDNYYQSGEGRSEIWALGLRNPWRYSFDRITGDLWIADVGQGNWEEINFTPANSPAGKNYGWYFREGSHPFKGDPTDPSVLVDPVFEYDHGYGCSVTGGYVYRGNELPEWFGVYLFGDFCNGKVWGLLPNGNNEFKSTELFNTGVNISSFGEDVFGEIYLISHNGSLYKLVER